MHIMFAEGTEDEVKDYCYKLVQQIGTGSGFILSSGCEVPLNARFENLKAVVNSVKL